MVKYKTVTVLLGQVDQQLNKEAADGWRLVATAQMMASTLVGQQPALYLILEAEVPDAGANGDCGPFAGNLRLPIT